MSLLQHKGENLWTRFFREITFVSGGIWTIVLWTLCSLKMGKVALSFLIRLLSRTLLALWCRTSMSSPTLKLTVYLIFSKNTRRLSILRPLSKIGWLLKSPTAKWPCLKLVSFSMSFICPPKTFLLSNLLLQITQPLFQNLVKKQ